MSPDDDLAGAALRWLALGAAALVAARALAGRSAARAAAPRASTSTTTPLSFLDEFGWLSPRHADEALSHAAAFDRAFAASFRGAAADAPEAAVRELAARRASVLRCLGELRMRLPNDLDLERRLAAAVEAADRGMLEHLEDARQRVGAPGLHPGPADAAWYGRWYRAANDAVA